MGGSRRLKGAWGGLQGRVRVVCAPPLIGCGSQDGGQRVPGVAHANSCLALHPPVPGAWCDWSPWTPCSRTCGSEATTRYRTCACPQPQHGGSDCSGDQERHGDAGVQLQRQDCPSATFCPGAGSPFPPPPQSPGWMGLQGVPRAWGRDPVSLPAPPEGPAEQGGSAGAVLGLMPLSCWQWTAAGAPGAPGRPAMPVVGSRRAAGTAAAPLPASGACPALGRPGRAGRATTGPPPVKVRCRLASPWPTGDYPLFPIPGPGLYPGISDSWAGLPAWSRAMGC